MPPPIASAVTAAFIVALFILDLRQKPRTSFALWIPAVYLFVVASRPISMWMQGGTWSSMNDLAEGSPLDAAFYLALELAALAVLVQRAKRTSSLLVRTGPVLCFLAYCLVSILWSDYPLVALKRWVKTLGDLMMVLVVLTDPGPLMAIRRFFAWPGYVLLPLSLLFIKYYPQLGRGYDGWTGAPFYHGVSYNKNGLGVICLYWGIGFFWLWLSSFDKQTKWSIPTWANGTMLAMSLWLLTKSSSATSLSCFIMGVTVIMLVRTDFFASRTAFIHVITASMVLLPFAVLFLGQFTVALDLLGRDSTLTDRTGLWAAIFTIGFNPILGAGYESFWLGPRLEKLWSIYWWRPTQAHNGYIELYINLGMVGIALLIAVLGRGYSQAISAVRRREIWGGLVLACIVVAVPYNFTEATFRMQNLPWIFLLLTVSAAPVLKESGGSIAPFKQVRNYGQRRTSEEPRMCERPIPWYSRAADRSDQTANMHSEQAAHSGRSERTPPKPFTALAPKACSEIKA